MVRRVVVAAAVVLSVGLSGSALAAGEVRDGAPAPAAALAAPEPAPPVTGQVDAATVAGATRQLSWGGIGVRLGYFNLAAKAEDIPMFGSDIKDNREKANTYIATFNEAVRAWNQANPDDQVQEAEPYGDDALNLDATLVQIIPTFHMGGDGYFFKLETPIGFGDGVTSLGLGLYPINYGYYVESMGLFPYLSAGLVLNYAQASTFSGSNGDEDVSQVGGIIQSRLALGAKYAFAESFSGTLELGFTPWGFAGLLDTDKAEKIDRQGGVELDDVIDLENRRPIDPGSAIRGGTISSAFDLSVGIEWI